MAELQTCVLVCSACDGSWLRRVKTIHDLLKGGKLLYHCPNASCKWSNREGPAMHVRKQDFGLDYKTSKAREAVAPPWKVRISYEADR